MKKIKSYKNGKFNGKTRRRKGTTKRATYGAYG